MKNFIKMLILLINKNSPHIISEEKLLFMGKCKLWRAALSTVGFLDWKCNQCQHQILQAKYGRLWSRNPIWEIAEETEKTSNFWVVTLGELKLFTSLAAQYRLELSE